MGKREIGELSVLDLVVFIMLGEMAVVAIEEPKAPLVNTLVPMGVLLCIQITTSYASLKSRNFRRLIDGKPSIIIKNGEIDENIMRRHRYNFDDLLMQLRTKDIANISDIEFAILETSGDLSIVKKSDNKQAASYTIPLILYGEVQQDHLAEIQKSQEWWKKNFHLEAILRLAKFRFVVTKTGNSILIISTLKRNRKDKII